LINDTLTPVIFQLGVGGIGGFLVGYAVKKVLKILAIFLGIIILILAYLGYTGIITVHYEKLAETVQGLMGLSGQASNLFVAIASHIPFAASFALGCALGFKKG